MANAIREFVPKVVTAAFSTGSNSINLLAPPAGETWVIQKYADRIINSLPTISDVELIRVVDGEEEIIIDFGNNPGTDPDTEPVPEVAGKVLRGDNSDVLKIEGTASGGGNDFDYQAAVEYLRLVPAS